MQLCSWSIDASPQALPRHNILRLSFPPILVELESSAHRSLSNHARLPLSDLLEDFHSKAAPDTRAMLLSSKLGTAERLLCAM